MQPLRGRNGQSSQKAASKQKSLRRYHFVFGEVAESPRLIRCPQQRGGHCSCARRAHFRQAHEHRVHGIQKTLRRDFDLVLHTLNFACYVGTDSRLSRCGRHGEAALAVKPRRSSITCSVVRSHSNPLARERRDWLRFNASSTPSGHLLSDAHYAADHDRAADDDQAFDDVLPFKGWCPACPAVALFAENAPRASSPDHATRHDTKPRRNRARLTNKHHDRRPLKPDLLPFTPCMAPPASRPLTSPEYPPL